MNETLEELTESLKHFSTVDYAVFLLMLLVCSSVGLFFGYKDHKKHKANKSESQSNSETLDYLLGGKNVQVFPGNNFKSIKKFYLNFLPFQWRCPS
jgi:solute carrier family 5 (sodium-coupled monocarboxylate transporter), member 8/12